MSGRLGPIDIECDAPSYPIVRACEGLGFITPLDVRWQRRPSPGGGETFPGQFGSGPTTHFFGLGPGGERVCSCGAPLPVLEACAFQFRDGSQVIYRIGQCPRCRTIYWDNG